ELTSFLFNDVPRTTNNELPRLSTIDYRLRTLPYLHRHFLRVYEPEVFDRFDQPFAAVDAGLPVQQLAGAGDVGAADLRVVFGQRLEDDLAGGPGQFLDLSREFFHRPLVRVAA